MRLNLGLAVNSYCFSIGCFNSANFVTLVIRKPPTFELQFTYRYTLYLLYWSTSRGCASRRTNEKPTSWRTLRLNELDAALDVALGLALDVTSPKPELPTRFGAYISLSKALFIESLQLSISLRYVVIERVIHTAGLAVASCRLKLCVE